ncbi:MAG TPA: hypothetical protein VNA16_00205, partial [Abditibacteriaceae bacterium]|nr:hypothetical protein [Abditibacteriaceae bacterium]
FLLHVNAVIQCFHAAPVATAPTQGRVLVGGQPVATSANLLTVAGCPFALPGTPPKPQPCVRVQWTMLSTRVLINGQPALLQAGPGVGAGTCLSVEQIPQGPPLVSAMQLRVSGM